MKNMNNNLMNSLMELLENNYIIEEKKEVEIIELAENEFEVFENSFSIGVYKVYNDYEEAKNEATNCCIDILDACGLNDNLIEIAISNDMVDKSFFEYMWYNTHTNMAYEEELECIITEEEQEQLNNDEITENEIRDAYFEALQESIEGNAIEECLYQLGDGYTFEQIRIYNLVNIEELVEYMIDTDGVGHFIGSYDNEELEHNGYYAYRVN